MSGQIFLSYRRDDTAGFAGRLYDRLHDRFPQNKIFIDVDSIDPGLDFVEAIEANVGACDVLIAVIGKRWLVAANGEGRRRLDNPEDFVRLEIGTALKRGIRVIPVLVEGVLMPQPGELPDDLRLLTRRNAIEVSHTRFSADSNRLIVALERVFEKTAAEKREREEKAQLEDVPQSQLPSPVAPSIAAAQPEADKPSAETPKVVHPLLPKPSGPERVKPPPSWSGGSRGKTPSKQAIAFLAIAVVLVVGGLIYLVIRASQSPPPEPVPVAAVTPGPTVIATPGEEKAPPTPEVVVQPSAQPTAAVSVATPNLATITTPSAVFSPLASSTPQPTPSLTPSEAEWLAGKRYLDMKDFAKALPHLQKAADAGNADAMVALGELYQNGQGGAQGSKRPPTPATRPAVRTAGVSPKITPRRASGTKRPPMPATQMRSKRSPASTQSSNAFNGVPAWITGP